MDTGTGHFSHTINVGTGHFGVFGSRSISVPNTSLSSVRHQDRYRTLRKARYDTNTGTGRFSKLDTTSIPVPGVPVAYRARPWYI